MRDAYIAQLERLADEIAAMCLLAGQSMQRATTALLQSDLQLAEQVIDEDVELDELRSSAEELALRLLALQAPVATDLRLIVAAIQSVGDLERMGGLARHVAKTARRRHPAPVLPDDVAPYFEEMGQVAVKLAADAETVIRTRDLERARKLDDDDDAMDDLHRHLFTVMMGRQWSHGVAAAVDVTLLGRFYERFADHAVSLAHQTVFVVTGKHSRPESSGNRY
ncbi:MAG: phosphate signaling complex protein PhoU [Pseudonocardiaceae bacterium]|nr:phosphate signaling complex protein PhoU [Pseudonocardiaceae bacterium]